MYISLRFVYVIFLLKICENFTKLVKSSDYISFKVIMFDTFNWYEIILMKTFKYYDMITSLSNLTHYLKWTICVSDDYWRTIGNILQHPRSCAVFLSIHLPLHKCELHEMRNGELCVMRKSLLNITWSNLYMLLHQLRFVCFCHI